MKISIDLNLCGWIICFVFNWSRRSSQPLKKHSAPPHDCLRYGSTHAMCHAITTGRISPWVIYNSDSGQKFLGELTADQVSMIWPYIDSDIWQKKFSDYAADAEYAKLILKQAGLTN